MNTNDLGYQFGDPRRGDWCKRIIRNGEKNHELLERLRNLKSGAPSVIERQTGTIKFFNDAKGFGFVTREGQPDVFLHASALPSGVEPTEGDKVSFEVVEGPKGKKAANVKLEF